MALAMQSVRSPRHFIFLLWRLCSSFVFMYSFSEVGKQTNKQKVLALLKDELIRVPGVGNSLGPNTTRCPTSKDHAGSAFPLPAKRHRMLTQH